MATPTELFPVLLSLDFDVKSGVELCGGDDQFYCDLIHELFTDVLVRRAEATQKDLQGRREYAHLLKGTLQVLGEANASLKARALEQALREGTPHEDLSLALSAELDAIYSALEKIFAKPTGT